MEVVVRGSGDSVRGPGGPPGVGQGMSEEAVRQTRSQKRALQKEAQPSDPENQSKKPKLDQADLTQLELEQDSNHRTQTGQDKEEEPLPLAPPSQSAEEDGSSVHRKTADHHTNLRDSRTRTPLDASTHPPRDPRAETPRTPLDSSTPLNPSTLTALNTGTETPTTETPQEEHRESRVYPGVMVGVGSEGQLVDLSSSTGVKREKRPPSPDQDDDDDNDDVIILSDNDSLNPPVNGLSRSRELETELLKGRSPAEREEVILQLKKELKLEEAKLVLLKKLRQSQNQQHKTSNSSSAPPPLIRGSVPGSKGSPQVVIGRGAAPVVPPALVKEGQQLPSRHGPSIIMPPLVRGSQQVRVLRQQQVGVGSSGGSGPPPLVGGSRTFSSAHTGLISNNNTLGSSSGSSISIVSLSDSPASRHTATKLALRKQLEKTLLEIPTPKPPPLEFHFMPSAANNEFIYLLGLEEVVHHLLDSLHRSKVGVARSRGVVREPFSCTQCHTDFTCRWRRDRARGGLMLCEDCMSSNQKKALKAQHTHRLKSAFVKALQQEQEMEQRLHQHSSSSSSSSSSVSQQLKQTQARVSSHQHQASRGGTILHHHFIKQQSQFSHGVSSVGVRGLPPSSQLVAAASLVSRPGKHGHVVQRSVQSSKVSSSGVAGRRNVSGPPAVWKKQSNSSTGVTMAYVNPSLTAHKMSSGVDARQREYLLDMIPSRPSLSHTTNTWK